MLKEEWRLNLAFASRRGLLLYPLFIFAGSAAAGNSIDSLTRDLQLLQLVRGAHLSLLAYGLFIGTFTFFGKEVMERLFGATTLLLGLPTTQPLTNRGVVLLFFVKDLGYYFATTYGPMATGLLLGTLTAGVPPVTVALFLVGGGASFATGLALAYLLAAVYLRQPWVAGVVAAGLLAPLLAGFAGLVKLALLLPPLAYHVTHNPLYLVTGWLLVVGLAALATSVMPERLESRRKATSEDQVAAYAPLVARFSPLVRLGRPLPFLLAKEWLDVFRSRTHYRMVFALAFPLLLFTGLEWFLAHSLPPTASFDFNTLFYGGLVGFFTVMLYSWLNNLDSPAFYATLPVSVAQVVKTKVVLFLLLSTAIPLVFLSFIAGATGELVLLPLAIVLLVVVSIYTVAYTAEATGLRTNSYLFDTAILLRFTLISTLPLIALVIISDLLERGWPLARVTGAVLTLCGLLLGAAAYFWVKIEARWGREEFT